MSTPRRANQILVADGDPAARHGDHRKGRLHRCPGARRARSLQTSADGRRVSRRGIRRDDAARAGSGTRPLHAHGAAINTRPGNDDDRRTKPETLDGKFRRRSGRFSPQTFHHRATANHVADVAQ